MLGLIFTPLRSIILAALIGGGLFLYGFGSSFVERLSDALNSSEGAKRQIELIQARERSHLRMIERRDAAIAASKCKAQIKYWIVHPDQVPREFNPFNQLGGN